MGVDKTVIVAGIGCRKGSSDTAVRGAINQALAVHGLALGALDKLATGEIKQSETGIIFAAEQLDLPLVIIADDALSVASARCMTHSQRSVQATGAASLSEASALAAVGSAGKLLGPRIAYNGVTCALARSEGRS